MMFIFRCKSGHRLMVVCSFYSLQGQLRGPVPVLCTAALAMEFNRKSYYLHMYNIRQTTVRSARRGLWHQLQEQVDLLSATSGSLGSIIPMDVNGIVLCYSYWDTMLIVLSSLWTCLCRSGSIVLCFEMLPMLMSGRNLVCLVET